MIGRIIHRRPLVCTAGGLALAALALAAPAARAEGQAPAVGEVVVVATPLDTGAPLSRTPGNAQTLTSGDIERRNPTSLADALDANLGSVSVSDGTGNPYQKDVNYRGFQATSLLGAPVGLAVYFDGVRANEPFGSIVNWDLVPINAVSSVQVQPGSDPVFGLNALGGALVVNTTNGRDSPGVAIGGLGGSFGRWAATVEAGGSDPATQTDYFLAGNYDRQTGWRDFSGSEVRQLFAKLRWHGPGDRTLIALSGAWADTRLNGGQALPMDMLSTPKAAYTSPDAVDNRMRLVNLKGVRQFDDADQVSARVYYRQSNSQSLNSNAQLDDGCFEPDGSLAVTPSGGYRCAGAAPAGTAANAVTNPEALALGYGLWTSLINASLVTSATRQATVGASAQWANSTPVGGRRNAFVLGAAFDQSDIDYRQDVYLARLTGFQSVVTPNLAYGFTADGRAPSPGDPPAFRGSNDLASVALGARMRELAVYVTDTLDLTSRFSVTASGSFESTTIEQAGSNDQYLNRDGGYAWTDGASGVSYYNPSYVGAFSYANAAAGAAAVSIRAPSGALAGPQANSLSGSHRYRRFNPRVGFNYNPTPALGLFGDYSESMRAPTSIELSCANPNSPCTLPTGFNGDPDLKAVTARTFELGGRGQLGKVSWNAALYDSRLRNDIQFIAASSTYGYFFNVGDTERRGVELGAQADLGRLSLSASYGYVEALYRSPFTTAAGEAVRSGDRIPGVPAHAFKLRARYRVTDDFRLGGGLIVAGEQYAHGNENNADPAGRVPGYAVVDLDAQYRIGKALKLSLSIDNLFDQTYATYGLSGTTSLYTLATEQFRTPAPPRAVWLKVSYAFGAAADRAGDD